jgi:hypothetical protein
MKNKHVSLYHYAGIGVICLAMSTQSVAIGNYLENCYIYNRLNPVHFVAKNARATSWVDKTICFLCIIVIGWITGSGPSMALCVTVGLAIGIRSSWGYFIGKGVDKDE